MIYTHDEQTIVARCTPIGSGALALIRISGSDALAIVTAFSRLSSKKTIATVATHTIHVGYVVAKTGETIDNVLFLVMHGPKTFTGQDTVEITCHNNQFIIQEIIKQAIEHGARLAGPGEFTKRAYLNKKLDLTQAEAVNELIGAHTQEALKKSLAQLDGSFTHWIAQLQEQLLQALVLCEASFEFIEDEDIIFDEQIRTIIQQLQKDLAQAHVHYNQQRQLKDGVRIALVGAVNAGKSSLFNALIKQDRAIVTEIAGTTRDAIETGVYRNNYYLTFVDTAGLRQTHDRIELEGIKRSFEQADQADIILLIVDGARQLNKQEQEIYQELLTRYGDKVIPVMTKQDLQTNNFATQDLTQVRRNGDLKFFLSVRAECFTKPLSKVEGTSKMYRMHERIDPLTLRLRSGQALRYTRLRSTSYVGHSGRTDFLTFSNQICKNSVFLSVSSTTGYNIDKLEQAITQKITKLTDQCELPFLINQRQHYLLSEFKHNLGMIEKMVSGTIDYELVAIHLKDALAKLAELTGKTVSEQSLDKIFRDFCVGK